MTEDSTKPEDEPPVDPDAGNAADKPASADEAASAVDTTELVNEEDAGEGAAENAAENAGSKPESASDSPSEIEKASRLKKRGRIISLCIAGCLLVTLALLLSGVFGSSSDTTVVEIAPRVIFEQRIAEVKAGESKAIHVDSFEIDDEMMQGIRGLESLETLIVDKGTLTDASMDAIASLPNLQHLRLRLSPITDEGLRKLSKCESLWFLNLPHSNCTAAGIEALADLKRLRQLRIGSSNLGNEVSREIVKIKSLRGLHLIGIAITDDGLKLIADMPHLESLYLDDSSVTTAGWDWVFSMKPQLHIHVDQQHHDRDPKAHVHR